MGIGEGILYQSEFSERTHGELRSILGADFTVELAKGLSILRYTVGILTEGAPALNASERRAVRGLRVRLEIDAEALGRLAPPRKGSRQKPVAVGITDRAIESIRLQVRREMFRLNVPKHIVTNDSTSRSGFKLKTLVRAPDLCERAAIEIRQVANALRQVEARPLPAGKPTLHGRNLAAEAIARTLRDHGVRVTKGWAGAYAKVLRVVLPEFGFAVPGDIGQLVRRSADRSKEPIVSRYLSRVGQVTPLLDD